MTAPRTPAGRALWSELQLAGKPVDRLIREQIVAIEDAGDQITVERWVQTTDRHPSSIDVGSILKAITTRYRLYGLWVQYTGDGTDRARHNEVVISVQYGWPGAAHAKEGKGRTVRDATTDLLTHLRDEAA